MIRVAAANRQLICNLADAAGERLWWVTCSAKPPHRSAGPHPNKEGEKHI
jgi:hypothetical protein